MLKLFIALGLMIPVYSFAADDADHVMMTPDQMKWVEAPPSLPKGAKVAVMYGDPGVAGPFGMRIQMPAKYMIPPHFHPQDENVTVISGNFWMATGDDAKAKMMKLPPGSFARMKAGTHHFARGEAAVVQINGMGPWGITYINPADDPRKSKDLTQR
ncbi:cupin domain-containing protein [Bdellovibrio sp. HCB185ZH]|uniref:cupin domain-containing protein n=1 Tax=Bdellovibrio sp. HCB185ZH TaxID=3394235 RepID=UPI0039A5A425